MAKRKDSQWGEGWRLEGSNTHPLPMARTQPRGLAHCSREARTSSLALCSQGKWKEFSEHVIASLPCVAVMSFDLPTNSGRYMTGINILCLQMRERDSRDEVICPKPLSWKMAESAIKSRPSAPVLLL